MPHVLPVAAFEIRDPIPVFVLMKTDDALIHGGSSTCSCNHPYPIEVQGGADKIPVWGSRGGRVREDKI